MQFSKEELNVLIEFLNHGRIHFSKKSDALKILENLNKIFGFSFPENFSINIQKKISEEDFSVSHFTINEKEPFEIVSDDSIFVVPTKEFKRETSEKEFDAGMAVLDEMDESIFNKKPKFEPLEGESKHLQLNPNLTKYCTFCPSCKKFAIFL